MFMRIFVNCSNHPSQKWLGIQVKAAEKYGKIIDVPFPVVDCNLSNTQIEELVEQTVAKIMVYCPEAVMCMGEFVVCYKIVQKLKIKGVKVLASCSERKVTEHIEENGMVRKESIFVFRRFREY